MRQKWLWITVAGAAGLLLLTLWLIFGFSLHAPPLPWATTTLQRARQTRSIQVEGHLAHTPITTVYAKANGTVASATFEEGDLVSVDDVLAVLANDALSNSLQEAADAVYALQVEITAAFAGSTPQSVTAPTAGRVIAVNASVGDSFADGAMAVIASNGNLIWSANAPGLTLTPGQSVTLAADDTAYIGIVASYDEDQLTVRVQSDRLAPGQSLRLLTPEDDSALSATLRIESPATVCGAAGIIAAIHVQPGDWVEADTPLFTLETPVTIPGMEAQLLEYEQRQRSQEAAKRTLDSLTLSAPATGLLINNQLEEGALLQAGQPVVTIAKADWRQAIVYVHESEAAQVIPGLPARLSFGAFANTPFETQVEAIDSESTTIDGQLYYALTLPVPYHDGMLPGMSASASVETTSVENVLLVPDSAVIDINGQPHLVRAPQPNQMPRAALRGPIGRLFVPSAQDALDALLPELVMPVTIGQSVDGQTAILSGAGLGDEVLLDARGVVEGA